MPHHVIVDGSNLATEGRTLPSLNQLNEAIASYRSDHPEALITVVVDATFGHRIDPSESAEFERAIETNAFVAPPAGAVGRGDGFILSIAQKVGAVILSNDSYQEFHGEYAWLFDQGRLVGGKPVPHVGWVFVDRVPVRGPVSRRSVKEQKVVEKSPTRARRGRTSTSESLSPDAPMPVPTSPPPGAVLRQKATGSGAASEQSTRASGRGSASTPDGSPGESSTVDKVVLDKALHAKAANDLMPFITFVQHHPVGSVVSAVVDHYSSHGAYVLIDDVVAYVPLRLMADPAPRSAREIMGVGDTVSLVVHSFTPGRRSIDLATPAMAPPAQKPEPPKARRAATKRAPIVAVADEPVTTAARRRRTSKALVAPSGVTEISHQPNAATKPTDPVTTTDPVKSTTAPKRKPAAKLSAVQSPEVTINSTAAKSTSPKPTAAKPAAAKPAAAKSAAAKSAAAKQTAAKPTAAKTTAAKTTAAKPTAATSRASTKPKTTAALTPPTDAVGAELTPKPRRAKPTAAKALRS